MFSDSSCSLTVMVKCSRSCSVPLIHFDSVFPYFSVFISSMTGKIICILIKVFDDFGLLSKHGISFYKVRVRNATCIASAILYSVIIPSKRARALEEARGCAKAVSRPHLQAIDRARAKLIFVRSPDQARLIDTAERIIFRFCSRGNWSRYHRVRPALALLWSTLAVSVDQHSASLTPLSRYQYLHALAIQDTIQPMLITNDFVKGLLGSARINR